MQPINRTWTQEDERNCDICSGCKTFDDFYYKVRWINQHDTYHVRVCRVCGLEEEGN
jgi:hypothetical protein